MVKQIFGKEFKLEAVRLLEKQEKDASQLARELGVRRNEAFPDKGRRSIKQNKTASLKAKIKRLEQENEILKKCTSQKKSGEAHIYLFPTR